MDANDEQSQTPDASNTTPDADEPSATGEQPAAGEQATTGKQPAAGEQAAAGEPAASSGDTLDAFVASLSDEQRSLFDRYTHGLKSALETERTARKRLERTVKDAAAKAAEGTELRGKLDEISSTLSTTTARLGFYEAAPDHAVRPKAVRLAYLAARDGDFLGDAGVDWDGLRAAYPDLFEAPPEQTQAQRVPTNGGAGTRTDAPPAFDMNRLIRQTR